MLVPAGMLVLMMLASISVDAAVAFMGKRELQNEVAAVANDAATQSIPDKPADGLQSGLSARPDPQMAQAIASYAMQHLYPGGMTVDSVTATVDGTTLTVTAHGSIPYIFAKAVPGPTITPSWRQRPRPRCDLVPADGRTYGASTGGVLAEVHLIVRRRSRCGGGGRRRLLLGGRRGSTETRGDVVELTDERRCRTDEEGSRAAQHHALLAGELLAGVLALRAHGPERCRYEDADDARTQRPELEIVAQLDQVGGVELCGTCRPAGGRRVALGAGIGWGSWARRPCPHRPPAH